MNRAYFMRFKNLAALISGTSLKGISQMENRNTFSRKRKMPLKDILLCTLSKKGLTTVMELRNYFQQKGEESMEISKQGYLQQRKRLNPEVFRFLNKEYLSEFYASDEPILWNGYLLMAIDGSKAEVPNSIENRETFGSSKNQHTAEGQVRAMVSGMMDVLNQFYLDIQIGSIMSSENELAKENLKALGQITSRYPVLVIFDRGYPSLEFTNYLEGIGITYLFRLSSNDYKTERTAMVTKDEIVELLHTPARLNKIKQKHPECMEEMKIKQKTKVRILKSELPSGNEITLMTNLSAKYMSQEIQDLYFKRWEIEKKYHTLKNKMKFESITGKAAIYVYQDFLAQVLVYNMMQDVKHSADMELEKNVKEKGYKYSVRTNENIAIGLFKEKLIKLLLESEKEKRTEHLIQLQTEIERYILPIRNTRSHDRKHNLSNKYKNNQKNSF